MPLRSVSDRLDSAEVLLMDGGTGSEIQRRGADVLTGATSDTGLQAWSATANIEFSDVVQQVHQDYLRCGADVIISNNFWTIPSRLKSIGLEGRWEDYARAAARNAVKARDAINSEAYVAGGMAAPTRQQHRARPQGTAFGSSYSNRADDAANRPDVEIMGEAAYKKEFADHARVLAEEGVDVLLPEFIGFIADCIAAVDACADMGLPVWLGVRHITDEGRMQYGQSLEDLGKALEGHPVDAVLLMCSSPKATSAGIPILRRTYDGIVGAYPNVGYNPTAPLGSAGDFLNLGGVTPSRLAEFSKEWRDMGGQIIGGCCANRT